MVNRKDATSVFRLGLNSHSGVDEEPRTSEIGIKELGVVQWGRTSC